MAAVGVQTTPNELGLMVPDVGLNFRLDDNIINALPPGCKVVESIGYSTAAWTRAARVSVVLADGTPRSFFLKCASDEKGRAMLNGEFESLKAMHEVSPSFIPEVYTFGKLKDPGSDTYFLLMEFLDLNTDLPDPAAFCEALADLHKRSVSPTGKFGFHITTHCGPNVQNTEWHDSWSFFFTRLITQYFEGELAHNGPYPEYEAMFAKVKEHVIPKILEPLQAEGRVLKPSLLHGDLWEGNCATNLNGGAPVIFDAASFYGHNELDQAMWRRSISRFSKSFFKHYLRNMPPSEPREQWDDRNRLYSLIYDMAHSNGWPESCHSQRETIMENMQVLLDKYHHEELN